MEIPEYRVKLIQAESEQLGHYLHTLSTDAWTEPSACQGWAVRDVVAHLILGAELLCERDYSRVARQCRASGRVAGGGHGQCCVRVRPA